MHPVHFASRQLASRERGLIGRGDEQKARRLELSQRFDRLGFRLHLFERQRRRRLISFHPVAIQNPIPLNKYGGSHN
jgi:hypothetical protein